MPYSSLGEPSSWQHGHPTPTYDPRGSYLPGYALAYYPTYPVNYPGAATAAVADPTYPANYPAATAAAVANLATDGPPDYPNAYQWRAVPHGFTERPRLG